MRENGDPLGSLKPQPGQWEQYHPQFHPLPGVWAQEQLAGKGSGSRLDRASHRTEPRNELQRALASERAQHEAANKQAGIIPGKPTYENPRDSQNTLLPVEKYASG